MEVSIINCPNISGSLLFMDFDFFRGKHPPEYSFLLHLFVFINLSEGDSYSNESIVNIQNLL